MTPEEIAEVRPRLATSAGQMLGGLARSDQRAAGELYVRGLLGECDLKAAADALVSNLSMLSPKATFERYSPTVISTRSG